MTSTEFYHAQTSSLQDFATWWSLQRQSNPDKFPKELSEEEWQEQFAFFQGSHQPIKEEYVQPRR